MQDGNDGGGFGMAARQPIAEPAPESGPRAGGAHGTWRRVVVKLSGEAFAGREPVGIDPDVVIHVAQEIAVNHPVDGALKDLGDDVPTVTVWALE